MTFKKYQTANNASWFLESAISPTWDTLIIQTSYADLFPAHNGTTDKDYQLTLEHFIDNKVTKREIVLVIHKVWNVFTVERSNGYCPSSRDATVQTNTAFWFTAGDLVELRTTAENDQDIKEELVRLDWQVLSIFESLSDEDIETTYNVWWQLEQVKDLKNWITANLTRYTTPTKKIEIQIVWDTKKYTVLYDENWVLDTMKYE